MTPSEMTIIKSIAGTSASRLVKAFGSLRAILDADQAQLSPLAPPAVVKRILSYGSVSRAYSCCNPTPADILSSPQAAGEYLLPMMRHLKVEEVRAIYVDARNAIVTTETIQRGTVDQSVVYPREVLRLAIIHQASGFILAHNHPSGDPTPSAQDRQLTDLIKTGATALGIRFLDHVIIGRTALSLKTCGLL